MVDAEAGFEPFDDATNYYGEEDCADAFDDEGFSARYFDQEVLYAILSVSLVGGEWSH